jgi:RimJ/RimL family protein N-acetyltransferase/ribosomal protein S18 acetylase RimI-like enzyme
MLPITTQRVTIRMMRVADAAVHAEYRNEPEVARYQSWDLPYSIDDARATFAAQEGRDGIAPGGWTTLAIELAGAVIGDVAVELNAGGSVAQLGYTLTSAHHGHGYATEAATTVVAALFESGVHRVYAEVDPEHVASMRVLEAIGMTFDCITKSSYLCRGAWVDNMHYSMTVDEHAAWLARPRAAPDDVRLVEITPDDAYLWSRLATHRSQQHLVAPMLYSFRDALFPDVVDGAPLVPRMRGIMADGERTGFMMTAEVTPQHTKPYLWRLLIDRMHQRRGIGGRALALLTERLRAEGHTQLTTSWGPGTGTPEQFYRKLGFVPTGEMDGEEVVGALDL